MFLSPDTFLAHSSLPLDCCSPLKGAFLAYHMEKLPCLFHCPPSNSTFLRQHQPPPEGLLFFVYISLSYEPPLKYKLHKGRNFILLCSLLYPQMTRTAHRISTNICHIGSQPVCGEWLAQRERGHDAQERGWALGRGSPTQRGSARWALTPTLPLLEASKSTPLPVPALLCTGNGIVYAQCSVSMDGSSNEALPDLGMGC